MISLVRIEVMEDCEPDSLSFTKVTQIDAQSIETNRAS